MPLHNPSSHPQLTYAKEQRWHAAFAHRFCSVRNGNYYALFDDCPAKGFRVRAEIRRQIGIACANGIQRHYCQAKLPAAFVDDSWFIGARPLCLFGKRRFRVLEGSSMVSVVHMRLYRFTGEHLLSWVHCFWAS